MPNISKDRLQNLRQTAELFSVQGSRTFTLAIDEFLRLLDEADCSDAALVNELDARIAELESQNFDLEAELRDASLELDELRARLEIE